MSSDDAEWTVFTTTRVVGATNAAISVLASLVVVIAYSRYSAEMSPSDSLVFQLCLANALYFCQVCVRACACACACELRGSVNSRCLPVVWVLQLLAGFMVWPYSPAAEWWCQAQGVLMTYLPLTIFSLVLCVNVSMYRLFVKVSGAAKALVRCHPPLSCMGFNGLVSFSEKRRGETGVHVQVRVVGGAGWCRVASHHEQLVRPSGSWMVLGDAWCVRRRRRVHACAPMSVFQRNLLLQADFQNCGASLSTGPSRSYC